MNPYPPITDEELAAHLGALMAILTRYVVKHRIVPLVLLGTSTREEGKLEIIDAHTSMDPGVSALTGRLCGDCRRAVAHALAAPFPADEVKWKPQAVKGNRAMAICYIDARCVMDRLDEVLGVGGWQDEYTPLSDHNVLCRLSLLIGGSWVAKADVGGESEQPDGGDRCKAAHSDALKRAAVKFGVGRYLYSLGSQWVDYDPAKRQFVQTPRLPAWALPKPAPAKTAAPAGPDRPYDRDHAPGELISPDYVQYLRDLARSRGVTKEQVCACYGVADLSQLTYADGWNAADRLTARPPKTVPQPANPK